MGGRAIILLVGVVCVVAVGSIFAYNYIYNRNQDEENDEDDENQQESPEKERLLPDGQITKQETKSQTPSYLSPQKQEEVSLQKSQRSINIDFISHIESNNLEGIHKMLLAQEVDIGYRNDQLETWIIMAARLERDRSFIFLVSKYGLNIGINEVDRNGKSALHHIAENNSADMAMALFREADEPVDIEIMDTRNRRAIDLARTEKLRDIIANKKGNE